LFDKSGASKGSVDIGTLLTRANDQWSSAAGLWSELLNIDITENKDASDALDEKRKQEVENAKTNKDVNMQEEVRKAAQELYKKYGKMFTLEQITEHLWNGMGANAMQENNEYFVRKAEDGTGVRIVVNNLGRGVDNLSLPAGMMQILEVQHGLTVSQPNADSYVSNSLFAMNLFNNIVGLTGTVSNSNRQSVLERMKFEINGNAPKVDGHSRLFKTEADMLTFISAAADKMSAEGRANFNLVLTPNSAIARSAYISRVQTVLNSAGITGVNAEQLTDKMIDAMNSEENVKKMEAIHEQYEKADQDPSVSGKAKTDLFTDLSKQFATLKNDILTQALSEYGLSADLINNLSRVGYVGPNVSNERLQALKTEIKLGTADFLFVDAFIAGRGWDVSNMKFGADMLQAAQNGRTDKVQATCWLLESELMTQSQVLQGMGRVDPFDNGRFTTEKFTKDIVSLYSVENARNVDILNQAVGESGVWDINVIQSNLETVLVANEDQALKKAGQKVLTQNELTFAQAQTGETMTMQTAQDRLASVTETADAAAVAQQMRALGIETSEEASSMVNGKKVTSIVDRAEVSRQDEFRLTTLSRTKAILSSFVGNEKAAGIIRDLIAKSADDSDIKQQLDSVLKGSPSDVLGFIQKHANNDKLAVLISAAQEVAKAKAAYNAVYENMPGAKKKEVAAGKFSISQRFDKTLRAYSAVAKELVKAEKAFSEAKKVLIDSNDKDFVLNYLMSGIVVDNQHEVVFNEKFFAPQKAAAQDEKAAQEQAVAEARQSSDIPAEAPVVNGPVAENIVNAAEALQQAPAVPGVVNINANTSENNGTVHNCLVMTLNTAGLVRNDQIAAVSARMARSLSIVYEDAIDNIKVAGSEQDRLEGSVTAAKVGAARELGDLAAGVITKESAVTQSKLNIGSGLTIVSETAGHAKTITGIADDGKYIVSDRGIEERKTLPELVEAGFTIILSNQQVMDSNAAIVKEVLPSNTKKAMSVIAAKFGSSEAQQAGLKMIEKTINGFAEPQDTSRAVLITVASFKNVEEMEAFMGLEGKYTKEDIAKAVVVKFGEALYMAQNKKMTVAERDLEISVIRVVSDILMASLEDPKIKDIVKNIKNKEGVDELQRMLPRERTVNKSSIANAMMQFVTVKGNNVMNAGDFEIDLNELKTTLEAKDSKFDMFGNKNEAELLNMIASGMRGQQSMMLQMNFNNIRAVVAAA
jgi:hypothetical protein